VFYYLSKLLPRLVYPTGLAVVLLVLALLLRHHRRYTTVLVALAVATLWLGGNKLVSMTLVRALEWRHAPLSLPQGAEVEAIVVLGGGIRAQSPPRSFHEVGEAGDRILYAAQLYREGLAPTIVVSGALGPAQAQVGASEAEAMADMLVFLGVPRSSILLEHTSRNTYENSIESSRLLAEHGLSQVLLVTSAMHMPRAYGVFRQQELDVIPAPTDYMLTYADWAYYTRPDPATQLLNLLPKAEYMELTEKVIKELLGVVVYRLRGWL
jgi:uncharacterized SAM-binding protein YcdF (DUF218 family)